jgi:soluble lytic murein transglycosylase-like protein
MNTASRKTRARLAQPLIFAFGLVATFVAGNAFAGGALYKWKDSKGVTHFSNVSAEKPRAAESTPIGGNASLTVGIATDLRAHNQVFKFRDGKGVTHYTDVRPLNQNYLVINVTCPACDVHSPINWGSTTLNTTAYADTINAASLQYGVDPAFVRAIIHAESAFNPQARSKKGAQGLMQVMPATAGDYGVYNLLDAEQNIKVGVRHLAGLLKSFNGDEKLAAAAYNAGEGAVKKYGGVPPYDETRVYTERVGVLRKRYLAGS